MATHNLARHQAEAGHEVLVLTNHQHYKRLKNLQFKYKILPLIPRSISIASKLEDVAGLGRFYIKTQLKLMRRKFKFDVLHAHVANDAGYFSSSLAESKNNASVVTCQGVDIQSLPEIGYGVRLDEKIAKRLSSSLPKFDKICIVGLNMLGDLKDLDIPLSKAVHIPNGAEVRRIQSLPVDKKTTRKNLGLPADKHILIAIGRNHPKKGYANIPDIVHELIKFRKDFVYVVIGKGTEKLEERCLTEGISEFTLFIKELPFISNSTSGNKGHEPNAPSDSVIAALRASDLFVFPTLLEGYPLVLIEAMAAGVPIVTTDAPGSLEAISKGDLAEGLVSRVGKNDEIASNINRLLSDKTLYNKTRANCLKTSERHNWDTISEAYLSLYNEIIQQKYKK